MAKRLQGGGLRSRQEGGLRLGQRGVALRGARRRDRVRQRHPEVDLVDQHLQHRRDDRRASWRTQRHQRPAIRQHNRRAHAAARPLPRPRRVGKSCREIEVGELVVEQEPAPRHDHATAADLLDRERVADDVAPSIRDGQMSGRDAFPIGLAAGGGDVLKGIGIARRNGTGSGGRPDQRATLGRKTFGEQAGEWNVDHIGISEVLVSVCVRQPRRLEISVKRLGAAHVVQAEAFEDVQRFADRRAAARWRAHTENLEAAIGRCHRLARDDLVVCEVPCRHQSWPNIAGDPRNGRRMLDRVDDIAADWPVVDGVRSLFRDLAIGFREVRVVEERPDGRRLASRRQVERASGREILKAAGILGNLQRKDGINEEALVGDVDRWFEELRQGPRAKAVERALPGEQGAGNADTQAARHPFRK